MNHTAQMSNVKIISRFYFTFWNYAIIFKKIKQVAF